LRVRSSCQRCPSPRRAAANFQSVSSGLTMMTVSFPETAGDHEVRGATGDGSMRGVSGAGTIARGAETTGGAGKTRGRSKGDRLTNGRNGATTRGAGLTTVGGTTAGGTKGWPGALGEASTGASAKGRWNSAERWSCCDCFSRRRRRATSPSGTFAEFVEGTGASTSGVTADALTSCAAAEDATASCGCCVLTGVAGC